MKLLHKGNYLTNVEKVFNDRNELKIAVAFFGSDSIRLFENLKSKNVQIICNLKSGACNPFIIERLFVKSNIHIKTHDYLHAKVIVNNNNVIIGSANLSANGLSLQDSELDGWQEIGVISENIGIINETLDWFTKIWNISEDISEGVLFIAKEYWTQSRNNRKFMRSKQSLLQKAISDIDSFKDRKVFFTIYYNQNASKEAIETYEDYKSSNNFNRDIDFFEDWSELPNSSYHILIYIGRRGGIYIEGMFNIPENPIIKPILTNGKQTGELNILLKVKDIYGHRLTAEDRELIKNNFQIILDKCPEDGSEGFIMPVYSFAQEFKKIHFT